MKETIKKIFKNSTIPLLIITICSLVFNNELLNVQYINVGRGILLVLLIISIAFDIQSFIKHK